MRRPSHPSRPSRAAALACAAIVSLACMLNLLLQGGAAAAPWQSVDPASAGWSLEKLKAAEDAAAALKPTALMIVQDGG